MAISRNKKQPTAKRSRVKNSTITDLSDFDPETTLVFDGDAIFEDYPEITYLGNLQEIKGVGDFRNSQVQDLGNLQTIGGYADFMNSRVEHLGNLQTIGDSADFEDSEVQNLGNLQTIGGNANFQNSKIRNLGKLQTIGHTALFQDSQVQNLGNLQTIVGSAFFEDSIVKRLGNLQTIGGKTIFGNRIDLKAEWELRQKDDNYAAGGGVGSSSITDLADFDPETTLVFDGYADFANYPEITDLGNLQKITATATFDFSQVRDLGNLQTIVGSADFTRSQVQSLGNLQTIGGGAYFRDSQVQDLGNLQTIGGIAYFKNSQVQDLGNLQTIGDMADFRNSQVQSLGNLLKIGGDAYFQDSQIQSLGNLQTIGGKAYFGNRTDLKAEWKQKQKGNDYAEGGGVEIPKNKSLRHFILNEMSDEMIANRVPYSDYATIDKIRIQAVQILNRDGDREYSMQSVSDLIQEALLEYEENKNYAEGGGVRGGIRYVDGKQLEWVDIMSFDIADYGEKEAEKKAYDYIEKSITYWKGELNKSDFKVRKSRNGKDFEGSWVVMRQYPKYANGGGVGMPNAAWFVFQEKFPEAFEYYLKNNEYGVSKGDLMAMAYESTRGVDSAIPTELWKQVDNTMFYVYDYQNSSFGELVDLREKIKTSEVPVALSFVIDMHGYYGDDLPNELKNADFATALMYVYANRDVIDEFQIRPKRNVDNYAEGGGVGDVFSMSKLKLENGEFIEMVIAENVSVADFERLFSDKGYTKRRDTTLAGFHFIKPNGDTIQLIPSFHKKGEIIRYAKGGGVGRKLIFESKEYDMPRGKTIYEVEVEDPYHDGETIMERYDNYDEAIDAYERSEIQFTPTWRTYLETNKPPYVYESGIVLPNGTLKVLYRKGRDVRHDWNGNEIVS